MPAVRPHPHTSPVSEFGYLPVVHRKVGYKLSYFRRPGAHAVLFLHGLGSSKDDFIPALFIKDLAPFTLIAFDYPGCGTTKGYPARLGLADLASLASKLLDKLGIARFSIVGHSTGGAVGLLLAAKAPDRVRSLISVEGNLAYSDCFISAPVAKLRRRRFQGASYLRTLGSAFVGSPSLGARVYGSRLEKEVNARAFYEICSSLVRYSKSGKLLALLKQLSLPKALIYGAANRGLPYLDQLRRSNTTLMEIPESDHWPMYANPLYFYSKIAGLLRRS